MSRKLVVILGPTASGKTDLAIKLAKKFNGEIVSADSRQVYKEMNIGTAKPSAEEIKRVPHHLIDVAAPNEEFNVAIFKELAIEAIRDIQKRGKVPFLVGGTGLYIWAVVDNLKFPKVSPQIELRKKLKKKTKRELFETYKKLDPTGARYIEKENKRRLIRAIEVHKVTGKSFWEQRKKGKRLFDISQIGIRLSREKLKEKIKKRVKKMFKMGLENEVKNLVKRYGWETKSLQTIGYQEFKKYLKMEMGKEELKQRIILHTIQFAKRQMTWFKRDKRIHWIRNEEEAKDIIKKFLKVKNS